MFSKILVANRGEIAVRAFRASYELGIRTVAIFPYEDRHALHREKADEAYMIGRPGHPVRAYLDVQEIMRVARESGADALYPGYGFLAENPELAYAAREANMTFIGPPGEVLEQAGNKVRALELAHKAGVSTLRSSPQSRDMDELLAAAETVGFPLFVKAVAGGGGRGMRRVHEKSKLPGALQEAMREARASFGQEEVFLEQAVRRARHIEVQILGDAQGNVLHLFERDCSLQRRHQKVVEMAPAPHLGEKLRQALCTDAVRYAQHLGYQNAGTVEFLVETEGERAGEHFFIEINPRIQVEHTVTEEITGVDLVQAQMQLAAGRTLQAMGLQQERITITGSALQCRVTTEDPKDDFRPAFGRITAYRSAGGAGVRLDEGALYSGAQTTPHFDSMVLKLTCRGRDHAAAVRRARRALAELRIRGVPTNIPFLQAVLEDPSFLNETLTTDLIERRPDLLAAHGSADRGSKLLKWLAHVTVNKPHGEHFGSMNPSNKLPKIPEAWGDQAREGTRELLQRLGPVAFAAALRAQQPVALTDTTFRDAHQSLLATRVRTRDLVAVGPAVSALTPQLFSAEVWGGATYDASLRFLGEDPWERLAALREALPHICLQMLLRGRNTVGYTPYPEIVTEAFIHEACETGVDIFRIFDACNDVTQMASAIRAVRSTERAIAEVAMCYTGNFLDPKETLYTLDYYLDLAEQMVDAGAHMLGIKDMGGLLRPAAAEQLVSALRERFDLPVHLHTHDTAGGQLATLYAAVAAGVDAVDVASAPLAGGTSQPSASALVAALENTARDPGIALRDIAALEPYWESLRGLYAPFESGISAPTGRVYRHEIPGGQLSNLRQQAIALGLGERFEEIEEVYAASDRILGRLVKVTPSSKVVGDLALHLVGSGAEVDDFERNPQEYDIPDSVLGFLAGELGIPPGGWPEPFREKALAKRAVSPKGAALSVQEREGLAHGGAPRRALLNRLLFPGPDRDFHRLREEYGDVSVLETRDYLFGLRRGEEHTVTLGKGVQLLVSLEAISEVDEQGLRTVVCTLNGQFRRVVVRDHGAKATAKVAEKAEASRPGDVAAPFDGVVTVNVRVGEEVQAGQILASIEAMKMEASITTPIAGQVTRMPVDPVAQVSGGDLLLVVE